MKYQRSNLSELCTYHIENAVQDVDGEIIYSNEKIYQLCLDYLFDAGKREGVVNRLLKHFNDGRI